MTDKELKKLKDDLWHSADVLCAGAHLAANKYGQPIGFGAAQQNLSQDLIKNVKIIMPTDEILQEFEAVIVSLIKSQKKALFKEPHILCTTVRY